MATKIKLLRKEAGLSLTELAQKAELSLGYVSRLESGSYRDLSLTTSKSLAKALGLTLKDFLKKLGFLDNTQSRPSLELLTQALRNNGYSNEQAEMVINYARFLRKQEPEGDK